MTNGFRDEVRKVWGNPYRVADVAFSELFNHVDEISLDYDDQVFLAKRVGVLAGILKEGTVEAFVDAFDQNILNEA